MNEVESIAKEILSNRKVKVQKVERFDNALEIISTENGRARYFRSSQLVVPAILPEAFSRGSKSPSKEGDLGGG